MHKHLVSLIGVVTRGSPKIVVISFCEHGELLGSVPPSHPLAFPLQTPKTRGNDLVATIGGVVGPTQVPSSVNTHE